MKWSEKVSIALFQSSIIILLSNSQFITSFLENHNLIRRNTFLSSSLCVPAPLGSSWIVVGIIFRVQTFSRFISPIILTNYWIRCRVETVIKEFRETEIYILYFQRFRRQICNIKPLLIREHSFIHIKIRLVLTINQNATLSKSDLPTEGIFSL